MRAIIEAGLIAANLDKTLITALLNAHEEAKRNFFLGGLRLNAVEAGRFCEAAFRLLEQITTGTFTPAAPGIKYNTDKVINALMNTPHGSFPESIRLTVPRALRVIYDVRNQRNTAHLIGGIDPNMQDATMIVAVMDWVLAEFVRLYHNVPADEASRIVNALMTRKAPAVHEFNGFLKTLRPDLAVSDRCVLLLYQRDATGATYKELESWLPPSMRANLRRTLHRLQHDKDYIHADAAKFYVTPRGQQYVERSNLAMPTE